MIDIAQQPWMILPSYTPLIAASMPMGPRERIVRQMSDAGRLDFSPDVEVVDGIATVRIDGVLTRRPEFWQAVFDGLSTELIANTIDRLAADESIDAIILRIESPGGEAAGMSEVAKTIRSAAEKKTIVSVADEMIASGAYFMASQTSKIYAASDTAKVGSIGTMMVLYDTSQLFASAGVRPVVLKTGDYKATGAAGTEVTDEQKAYLQGLVNETQALFEDAVKTGRGLSGQQLAAAADGRVFHPAEALRLNLIDGVRTYEQVFADLQQRFASPKTGVEKMSQAATFTELKSCLPGAGSDFVCEAMEKEWTLDQAQSTWMERQAAENKKLKEEIESAKAMQKSAPVGVEAASVLEHESGSEPAIDAREAWNEAIAAEIKSGRTRQQAVIHVSRRQPELRAQLLAAANSR